MSACSTDSRMAKRVECREYARMRSKCLTREGIGDWGILRKHSRELPIVLRDFREMKLSKKGFARRDIHSVMIIGSCTRESSQSGSIAYMMKVDSQALLWMVIAFHDSRKRHKHNVLFGHI